MKKNKKVWVIVLVVIIVIAGIYYLKSKTGNALASDCFKAVSINGKTKDVCYIKSGGKSCGGYFDCEKKEVCGYLLTPKSNSDLDGVEGQIVLSKSMSGQCFVPEKKGFFVEIADNTAIINYLYLN